VYELREFEGGIGVPKHGGPLNSTGAWLLNHQTSKISLNSFWRNFFFGCFRFKDLKVELGFPSVGDPLIAPGQGC
jgi:hypothetical protein